MSEEQQTEQAPQRYIYTVFMHRGVPLNFESDVDLVAEWHRQLQERARDGDWWRPFEFKNGDEVIARFMPQAIVAIIKGALAGGGR